MIRTWVRSITTDLRYSQPNSNGRNLVLSVLNSTVTKREAKDYLNKYADESKLNYCLVYLKHFSSFSGPVLQNFSKTLAKIQTLGLRLMLVLDPASPTLSDDSQKLDELLHKQQLKSIIVSDPITFCHDGSVDTNIPLMQPHIIPIIQPFQFFEKEALIKRATDPAMLLKCLIQNLPINLDKLIIVSKFGGIPSIERHDNSHVFVNLSQEYEELRHGMSAKLKNLELLEVNMEDKNLIESLKMYNNKHKIISNSDQLNSHLQDLRIMNEVLSILPSSSTGILTTPTAAAKQSENNPLVYNILTDRSLISSSLPRFKRNSVPVDCSWYELPSQEESMDTRNDSILVTTVFKKGIEIHIFDYQTLSKENCTGLPPSHDLSLSSVSSTSEKLDLRKVKRIIDASFKRSLDLTHYLNRINGRIASVIVIGDYEGIAILTYEGPLDRQFVYLDKFAVMPHLKGSLGISDIIFNLMFKKYPKELIWRSREDNVVNKWYFQRSTGVLHLSTNLGDGNQKKSIFKMFYYGDPEIESFHDINRLREYAEYVRDIKPSWEH